MKVKCRSSPARVIHRRRSSYLGGPGLHERLKKNTTSKRLPGCLRPVKVDCISSHVCMISRRLNIVVPRSSSAFMTKPTRAQAWILTTLLHSYYSEYRLHYPTGTVRLPSCRHITFQLVLSVCTELYLYGVEIGYRTVRRGTC
jgi:hypothetical protein